MAERQCESIRSVPDFVIDGSREVAKIAPIGLVGQTLRNQPRYAKSTPPKSDLVYEEYRIQRELRRPESPSQDSISGTER